MRECGVRGESSFQAGESNKAHALEHTPPEAVANLSEHCASHCVSILTQVEASATHGNRKFNDHFWQRHSRKQKIKVRI